MSHIIAVHQQQRVWVQLGQKEGKEEFSQHCVVQVSWFNYYCHSPDNEKLSRTFKACRPSIDRMDAIKFTASSDNYFNDS